MSTRILIPRNRILVALLAAALALPCAAVGQGRVQDHARLAAAARDGGNALGWLAGTALAAFALLVGGQVAMVVLLNRIGGQLHTIGLRLGAREKQMNMKRDPLDSADVPPRPAPARPLSDAGVQPPGDGTGDGQPRAVVDTDAADADARDASGEEVAPAPESLPVDPPPAPSDPGSPSVKVDPDVVHDPAELDTPSPPGPAWPGGDHALYVRGRGRLAQVQEERGEKDRARLEAAAARWERRRAWVLGLHEAWENEVDFAYLRALENGTGVVKDAYVMLYPVSEHDWKTTHADLRRLADHIGALPEAPDPHWPALLPRTGMRSSVDFDLRVQPPQGTSPAAEFHARRLLATLLVNLKTLHRARAELARLVHGLAEGVPAAEARLADVSPQALAILDAVCAPGLADAEREAAVDAAMAELEAMDSENFRVVQGTEQRAERLERGYRAFLKVLFRVVDGTDRARALHREAMDNGLDGEPWLAAWGEVLAELDDLLVRRVLGGRLEITPIPCVEGDPLDIDLHNPLGSEPVPGVEKDQVWRVESRGFAYAEDGALRVVRHVDVIAAVPA